jgi:hypothetical protein
MPGRETKPSLTALAWLDNQAQALRSEPIRGFDKGTVTLVEIPAGKETSPAEPLHLR